LINYCANVKKEFGKIRENIFKATKKAGRFPEEVEILLRYAKM